MNMFFTKLGHQLYDMIGSPENNTVGHVTSVMYSEGGLVSDETGTRLTDNDPLGVNSLIKSGAKSISKTLTNNANDPNKAFKEQMTNLHYITSNFGHFFKGGDTGGTNDKIKPPVQGKGISATDPNDFYAKWYMSMRRFSEAAEVASRGQTTVRSR
jgi:hypothetical protein